MESQKQKWNKYYSEEPNQALDPWLLRYSEFFMDCGKVLDLGCGNGSNIPFLQDMNAEIVAIDYSETAIDQIKRNWDIDAFVHDIRNSLPFADNSFDMILADLSLHYFSYSETTEIVNDLYRVTKDKGMLVARVNSTNDVNHGSGTGIEIERNYYNFNGRRKRFFDKEMIHDLFDYNFVISKAIENRTTKYNDEKVLWEITTIKMA